MVDELVGIAGKQSPNRVNLDRSPLIFESQKYDSSVWTTFPIDSLAEVLVIGDQNSVLGECLPHHIRVVHATRFVIYGENVVPVLPQPSG